MKLGCASWGFREFDLAEYFEAVASMGLKYMEVECFKDAEVPKHILTDWRSQQALYLQERAEVMGLRIVCFAAGNDFTTADESALADDIRHVKEMIDLAEAGGVEFIRLFAGWMEEDELTDAVYDRVIDGFRRVGEYAGEKSVTLALENHGGITRTAGQVKRLLDGIGLPSVGATYDPANFSHCRVDPVQALEELKDDIVYVHLKDSRFRSGEHEYGAVGAGEMDWAPIVGWLNASYDGYAMIEYEETSDVMEGTRQSIAFLQGMQCSDKEQGK